MKKLMGITMQGLVLLLVAGVAQAADLKLEFLDSTSATPARYSIGDVLCGVTHIPNPSSTCNPDPNQNVSFEFNLANLYTEISEIWVVVDDVDTQVDASTGRIEAGVVHLIMSASSDLSPVDCQSKSGTAGSEIDCSTNDWLSDGAHWTHDFVIAAGEGNELSNIGVNFVPIPAAAWLFGSGLIGLAGMSRRRKAS